MRNDSSEIELTLDSLAFGGEAVGRDSDGRVVFVAGGAPGDRVLARVVEKKRSFARAELVRVLAPGARVTPPCPIVERCGGCPWQQVAIDAQLAAKQAIVERALHKSGAQVMPIVPSPASLGYRTRARMSVRGAAVGFQARRSHEVVDVEKCLALEPRLDAAMQAARRALGPLVGDGGTIAGLLRDDGVEIAIATVAGADVARPAKALVGQAGIVAVTVDEPRAPAAGFAQANAAQNERLRALVRDAADARGRRVLELYAGDGNFTRELAAVAASGVAVEGDRSAAARLAEAARNFTVVAEPAARAVERLARAGEHFDVVLLDPPRAGAIDVVDGIARLQPSRVVYVSCDPMTLARDLDALSRHGLVARTAWPVDMMPHTWHIEVVCLITPDASRS
jgi:23S rRNA (uracil1939-C5)-methyltransferase